MRLLLTQITSSHNPPPPTNYSLDCLFVGLRSLLGSQVVDIPRMPYMYEDFPRDQLKAMWGRGLSLYGFLPNVEVDRETNECDAIILGLHHSVDSFPDEPIAENIRQVKKAYGLSREKVILIDGSDRPRLRNLTEECIYFKRELLPQDAGKAIPLGFGLPAAKCVSFLPAKTIGFSNIIPADQSTERHYSTYIYEDEESYYNSYRGAYFGLTGVKGGAECLRHYEILLGGGTIPFFLGIEDVPDTCMADWPKHLLQEARCMRGVYLNSDKSFDEVKSHRDIIGPPPGWIHFDAFDTVQYNRILTELFEYGKTYLTAEAVATKVLSRLI